MWPGRFLAYGWNVERVSNANDLDLLREAFDHFKKTTDRPTLIIVDSHIGYGAPTKQDTSAAHGEPLGEEEIRATKKRYGWPEDAKFLVPPEVREDFKAKLGARGAKLRGEWMALFSAYEKEYPELAAETLSIQHREPPKGWDAEIPSFPPDAKGIASRDSSGKVLNAIAKHHPWLIGGSADLSPSTKTRLTFEGAGEVSRNSLGGRNIHFGVREHAMGAILNGLALAKLRAFGSGFLIFSDYGKGSLRLAAIMELPVIYIFTHDSIGVGEDGPTHQPVEHLAALRSIPGLVDMRPCDANEVAEAWRVIIEMKHEPVALILSRQALPTLDRSKYAAGLGPSARRLRSLRGRRRKTGRLADRHRERGLPLHGRAGRAEEAGGGTRESLACRRGSSSRTRMRPIANRSFLQISARGSRSSRRRGLAGSAMWESTEPASA